MKRPKGIGSEKNERGGCSSPFALLVLTGILRNVDAGAITGVGDGEGAGRGVGGVVIATPIRGTVRNRSHEGTGGLAERVGGHRGQIRERRRDVAHVRRVDADGGRESP